MCFFLMHRTTPDMSFNNFFRRRTFTPDCPAWRQGRLYSGENIFHFDYAGRWEKNLSNCSQNVNKHDPRHDKLYIINYLCFEINLNHFFMPNFKRIYTVFNDFPIQCSYQKHKNNDLIEAKQIAHLKCSISLTLQESHHTSTATQSHWEKNTSILTCVV